MTPELHVTVEKIAILLIPIFLAALAWFIRRMVKQIDKAADVAVITKDALTKQVSELSGDVMVISSRTGALEEHMKIVAGHVTNQVESLRKTQQDLQNRFTDCNQRSVCFGNELREEVQKVFPMLSEIGRKMDRYEMSLSAASHAMRIQQKEIKEAKGRIEEIGRVMRTKKSSSDDQIDIDSSCGA